MNHKVFNINKDGRDFIISDLHGCYDLLEEKIKEISFDFNNDRLFSVGDLIDRGPKSMMCLQLLVTPWFHSVRGNHEQFLIDTVLHEDNPYIWINNGGSWFIDEEHSELYKYALLANQLPYAITVKTDKGDIGICHAEPKDSNWGGFEDMTMGDKSNMIWGRRVINESETYIVNNVYETYHGHTPISVPIKKGNINFIDTGAFFTGNLTMLQIN